MMRIELNTIMGDDGYISHFTLYVNENRGIIFSQRDLIELKNKIEIVLGIK